ncbi:MAG: NAD(P)-dependent oxidoreductase [Verrucomicrobiae bacterium]|nr:NAD(P)-dependent oxidoreductase [Verrucomicrobiae bacterium]
MTTKNRPDDSIDTLVILGHTGFVGSRLTAHFQEKHPRLKIIPVSSRDIDLSKAEQCERLKDHLTMRTMVIMTAGIKSNYGNDVNLYLNNVSMAANICRIISDHPVRKFVFFSSIAVYGVDVSNRRLTEQTAPDPDTYYGLSKFDSERLLSLAFSKLTDSSLVLLRVSSIYGPGEKIIAPTPSGFLITYLEGGEVTLWGDGSEYREFLFIDDIVRIVEGLYLGDYEGVLNVGGHQPHTYRGALKCISQLLGKKIRVRHKPRSKKKVDKVYDRKNSLVRKLFPRLEFTPLETGLEIIRRQHASRNPTP